MRKIRSTKWLPMIAFLLAAPFAGAQSLLNENFDGPGMAGWNVFMESNTDWDVSDGSYNMRGHHADSPGGSFSATRAVVPLSSSAPSTWSFESRFFMPLANNFYGCNFSFAGLNGEGGSLGFFNLDPSDVSVAWVGITSGPQGRRTAVTLNQWHTLRVGVMPTAFTAYVDGAAIGSISPFSGTTFRQLTMNNATNTRVMDQPMRIDYIRVVPEPSVSCSLACLFGVLLFGKRRSHEIPRPDMCPGASPDLFRSRSAWTLPLGRR